MTKYVFTRDNKEDILYLEDQGELETKNAAAIEYYINRYCMVDDVEADVTLHIDHQSFEASDLEELIEFLTALKEEISK